MSADVPSFQPHRRYNPGRTRRLENRVMSVLVGAGLIPHSYLLTTHGRKTGRIRRNPVVVAEHDGKRWLVAPYGPVSWVHNARAAGHIELTRRWKTQVYTIREVSGEEAGPILKLYVGIASATRSYFQADPHAPVEDFVAEAAYHPVFELTPTTGT
jgi:deazaflavin-dependent oxidoreductase (nitroreductase family)